MMSPIHSHIPIIHFALPPPPDTHTHIWHKLFFSISVGNMSTVMHQSIPGAPIPPPPRATAGHLCALSVPGVGHYQILHGPGVGDLPSPGLPLGF